jgi:hypothetical protein
LSAEIVEFEMLDHPEATPGADTRSRPTPGATASPNVPDDPPDQPSQPPGPPPPLPRRLVIRQQSTNGRARAPPPEPFGPEWAGEQGLPY